MFQQQERTEVDPGHRRLVAGEEQGHGVAGDLPLAQRRPFVGGGD
jgi:hypothetical protein